MKIIRGLEGKTGLPGSVVTLGAYDGIHLGHQKILSEVVAESREQSLPAVAMTFEPHPSAVLSGRQVPLLTMRSEKLRVMAERGITHCVIINFTRDFAKKPPEDFVKESITGFLRARTVIVGFNYVFGAGRKGTPLLLEKLGEKYGFSLKKIRPVKRGPETISSSLIRKLILEGCINKANRFLGRPFSVEGTVVEGEKRGQELGFPTANIALPPGKIVPGAGVYAGECEAAGAPRPAVLYTGLKPTFGGRCLSVEIHIIGFSGNIYGEEITFRFRGKIRGEARFKDEEILKKRISDDIAEAKLFKG